MEHVELKSDSIPAEYHVVDISSFPSSSGVASEPQLVPTTGPPETTPEDLNFVSLSVESHGNEEQFEGDMGVGQALSSDELGSMKSETRRRVKGRASEFLESKGFGWLMEVEEEESEEENRPLLLVSSPDYVVTAS